MRQRNLALFFWGLLLASCAAVLLQGPRLQSDLGQFLPKDSTDTPAFLLDTLRDGPASRLLMLDLSGAPAPQLAEAARKLAAALADTSHFSHVLGAVSALSESEDALLFRYRYLLNSGQFDRQTLRDSLQQRLHEMALGVLPDHQQLRRDPTAQHRKTLQRLASQQGPQRHLGVWFSPDQQHALLLLHSRAPAFALDQQEQAIETIHTAFAEMGQPQIKLTLSGPATFAVASRQQIREESQRLTLIASFGVLLLVLAAYRSPRTTLLIALPLLSAILVGAATVVLLFGQLHGIALAFGITLIGVSVDYPIHLFSHGGDKRAAKHIWPTLRLGVITSLLGFSALLFSDFEGLSQMGLLAISGLLTAALVTRWVIPPLQGRRLHLQLPPHLLQPLLQPRRAQRLLQLGVWLLLSLSLAYLGHQGEGLWEQRLDRLSPIPHGQLEQDRQMRQRLNAAEPGRLLLLHDRELEPLLQRTEALNEKLEQARNRGLLDGYDTPTRYLPSQQRQLARRDALPESLLLKTTIAEASEGLPFRKGLFQPFVAELEASRQLPPLTADMLQGTLSGLRLNSLLRQDEDGWYALVTLAGIHEPLALQQLAAGYSARLIDIPQEASRLVSNYRDDALQLLAAGVAAIVIVLSLALRSATRMLRVILPVATAAALTAALLSWSGEQLSLFHLTALLLVLGIGLDYGLFFDRCRTNRQECINTLGALLICATTTLLVFGLLASSSQPVLHALGITVSLGVLFTLLLTVVTGNGRRSMV